jgi:hypothetical protein
VADINKAAMRNRILERLGVLAAGETPASADQTYVEEMIDAAHEELRKKGLAPYLTSAFPSWAQISFRNWCVAECGPAYGKPWGEDEIDRRKMLAERRLSQQCAVRKQPRRTRAVYY